MKILVMNSLDDRYGSTYRIRAFANELKIRKHDVVYFEKKCSFFVKIFSMPKEVFKSSFDVLLIQKFNPLTFFPILIAKMRGKYVIVDWDDWDTGLQKNLILKIATWLCEETLPNLPDLITSHNTTLLSLVPSKKETLLLEQGFDPELFDQKHGKARDPNKIRIGYMCTFTHGGTLDLNDLFIEISEVQNPTIEFVIIGGGSLLKSYQEKAERLQIKNATFMGQIHHDQIPQLLQSLDLGLIYMKDSKSNRTRVSFKVIEYLASGLPILGQAVGETQKLYGNFIENCPINQLAIRLNALTKANLPSKMAPIGLLKGFTWSNIIDKLILHLQTTKGK